MVINRRHITLIIFLLLSLSGISQHAVIGNVASSRAVAGGSFDTDAQAFFTATAISDGTIQNAINTYVLAQKAAGNWSTLLVDYPFVGGTASTNKFNLKDPRDLDAAFRLVFSGTWTHSASGADPNGTTAFGDTKFAAGTSLTAGSGGMTYFSNETSIAAAAASEAGVVATNNDQMSISIRYTGNLFGAVNTALGASPLSISNSVSEGAYTVARTATNTEGYKNGSRVINTAQTGAAPATFTIYVGAINNKGTAAEFTSKRCSHFIIHSGIWTTTQELASYNAMAAMNTALSR